MSALKKIQKDIKDAEYTVTSLQKTRDEIRANQMFRCVCGGTHKIKTCDAIQTHWYTQPSGCSDGDYWNTGEILICCPTSERVNRVLFNNYDVEWDMRNCYSHDPEQQFIRIYGPLFKNVTETYREETPNWYNNEYFDKNRKKFGLVEKTKSNATTF